MANQEGAVSPNSALNWGPVMEDVASRHEKIHFPETKFVGIDAEEAMAWLDGEGSDLDMAAIESAAGEIGYPVFVRTDITSAKHQGLRGIRARDADELRQAMSLALESNFMAMAVPWPKAIVLREWIDLDYSFTADAQLVESRVPIAREFRVFARPEGLHCIHFYWPQDAINGPSRDDWQEEWCKLNQYGEEDEETFRSYGSEVAYETEGAENWSVDFAADEDGQWWAIDMAKAGRSWHPEDCPNNELFQESVTDS